MFAERSFFLNYLVTDPLFFLQFIVIIVVSITLHELGHGAAAISQGDNTPTESGHMTLNPVVHMGVSSLVMLMLLGMAWGQMPVRPNRFKDGSTGNMIVAAAGPVTNFAIAALCIIVLNFLSAGSIASGFFRLAAYVNIGLGIFNLIPVPPLDGFTVFSELFPGLKPVGQHPAAPAMLFILFFTGGLGIVWQGAALILNSLA